MMVEALTSTRATLQRLETDMMKYVEGLLVEAFCVVKGCRVLVRL